MNWFALMGLAGGVYLAGNAVFTFVTGREFEETFGRFWVGAFLLLCGLDMIARAGLDLLEGL